MPRSAAFATPEIIAAIAGMFVGGKGASHNDLDEAFSRLPTAEVGRKSNLGEDRVKERRVRNLVRCLDTHPVDVDRAVRDVVPLLGARGCLDPAHDWSAGSAAIAQLRGVFADIGYEVTSTGALREVGFALIDNLVGDRRRRALIAQINRIRLRRTIQHSESGRRRSYWSPPHVTSLRNSASLRDTMLDSENSCTSLATGSVSCPRTPLLAVVHKRR